MLLGDEQTTALQRRALREAGCERFFDEAASGGRWNRPELHRMLDQLRPGDVVVVWKLDRLSRSLKDLLHLFDQLKEAGAGFWSLTGGHRHHDRRRHHVHADVRQFRRV